MLSSPRRSSWVELPGVSRTCISLAANPTSSRRSVRGKMATVKSLSIESGESRTPTNVASKDRAVRLAAEALTALDRRARDASEPEVVADSGTGRLGERPVGDESVGLARVQIPAGDDT